MSNIIVTPEIVRRVDSNLRNIYTDAWVRRAQNLWWKRLAKVRTSGTKTELLMWMLDTAQIHNLGSQGGERTFEDLVEVFWEIENSTFGASLNLNADEISDALGGTAVQGSPLDRATRWARAIGNQGAYWPQKQMAYLLKNGKTLQAYDGGAFFRANHPVNPYVGTSSGTYANLLTGYPLNPTNLARVVAYVQSIPAPDGNPRHLMPSIVAAGPDKRYAAVQALGAESFTDPKGTGEAAASNIIKTTYGFQEPIIAPEFDEPGVWYLGCELLEDDELGGLIYQEREAYYMTTFTTSTDAELARANNFEWHQKGRNASSYGHPFLLFRIEGAGSEAPVLPDL